jgi:hypothetical protein
MRHHLLALAVLLLAERAANACSVYCNDWVLPRGDAVPRNVELMGIDVRGNAMLVSKDGVVPLDRTHPVDEWIITRLAPAAPLAPDTVYTFWFKGRPEVSFRTSAKIDTTPPAMAKIRSLWVTRNVNPGGYSSMEAGVSMEASGDVASYLVTVTGVGGSDAGIVDASRLDHLGAELCSPTYRAFYSEMDGEYCFELRPRDVAGNVGPPSRACTTSVLRFELDESEPAGETDRGHAVALALVALGLAAGSGIAFVRRARPVQAL